MNANAISRRVTRVITARCSAAVSWTEEDSMDGVKGANHNTRLAFEGVVAFPVTPFRGDLTLDVKGPRRTSARC